MLVRGCFGFILVLEFGFASSVFLGLFPSSWVSGFWVCGFLGVFVGACTWICFAFLRFWVLWLLISVFGVLVR